VLFYPCYLCTECRFHDIRVRAAHVLHYRCTGVSQTPRQAPSMVLPSLDAWGTKWLLYWVR
jgi:hypothetical protein